MRWVLINYALNPIDAYWPNIRNHPSATVLIIDDEEHIRRAVKAALHTVAGAVVDADTGCAGLAALGTYHPDIIILDLGLPDMEGVAVCRAIRMRSMVPIVVLTARHAEPEKVELLNAGADDYVTKPFGTAELAARVAAQLRRIPHRQPDVLINVDGLSIDFERRIATRGVATIRLTPIEWAILRTLSADPGRVLTHQQLFDAVWGQAYGDVRQYLRVHVTHLRRKIESDPANPSIIITEPGVGYRFNAPM